MLGKTTNTVFSTLVKVVEGFKAARGRSGGETGRRGTDAAAK